MVLNGNGFDSVKTLKAIAMANFSRRRKLKWLFEFSLFLFLISHRSSLFSLAGPVLRRLLAVLNSHIFVFVFFHAMLFVVYSLSRLTDNKSASNRTHAESGTAASGDISVVTVDDSVAEKKWTAKADVDEVPIGETPSADPTQEPDSAVRHLTGIPTPTSAADSAATEAVEMIPEADSAATEMVEMTAEIKRYRRSKSERFEVMNRETSTFRRSKTEIVRSEVAGFLNSVDEMDIDDFNRTVESFIAAQKMHIGGRISG